MHKKFISKSGASRLILIYADWATDWHLFAGLEHEGYDIAVISNYTDLSFKWKPFFEYDEIVLIGWGFGVFAASLTAHEIMPRVSLSIAVNGTLDPVNNTRGMHLSLFDKLKNTLTPSMLWQYWRRMASTSEQYAHMLDCRPARTLSSLVDELVAIDAQLVFHVPPITDWHLALVSRYDVIFPADNQRMAWDEVCPIVVMNQAHFPDFKDIFNRFVVKKASVDNSSYDKKDADEVSAILLKSLLALSQSDHISGDVLHLMSENDSLINRYLPEHSDGQVTLCGVEADTVTRDRRVKIEKRDAETLLMRKSSNSLMYIVGSPVCNSINSPKSFLSQCNRTLVSSGFVALAICDVGDKDEDINGIYKHMDNDLFERWIKAIPGDMDVFVNAVKKMKHNYLLLILRKV